MKNTLLRGQVAPALLVSDMAATLDFYNRLGFRLTGCHPDRASATWTEVTRDTAVFQFHTEPPHGTPPQPVCSGTFYLSPSSVSPSSVGSLVDELTAAGVTFEWGPEVMEYGMRKVAVRDPSGYLIAFTEPVSAPGPKPGYVLWRRVHLGASGLLALLALAHSVLTFVFYSGWSADAVWFLGTGLGLLLLAVLNLTHIGVEPCRQASARVVRLSNPVFALFGVAAVVAVPEPQAFVVLVGLVGQALAAQWTLPGPD